MPRRKTKLHSNEVALIKAMLQTKQMKKQDIAAYFSRPNRSINQARITQISQGKIGRDVPAATSSELKRFLQEFEARQESDAVPHLNPIDPERLAELLRTKEDRPTFLHIGENDGLEFKEKWDWGSRIDYMRSMAGFANNRGGYIVFGVIKSGELQGVNARRFEEFDVAQGNQVLRRTLNPMVKWEKCTFVVGTTTLGVVYVWPNELKPVIWAVDQGGVRAGTIFHRYPAETSPIGAMELFALLQERDRRSERRLFDVIQTIAQAGAKNVATLNLETGALEGGDQVVFVDEGLLSKLQVVREGQISETEGAPTLRIVGDLQPAKIIVKESTITLRDNISDIDLLDDFLAQKPTPNPMAYVRRLVHSQALWLPAYYFANQTGKTIEAIAEELRKDDRVPSKAQRDKQVQRLLSGALPAGLPSPSTYAVERTVLANKEQKDVSDWRVAKDYCRAAMTLTRDEIDFDYIISLMRTIYDRHYRTARPGRRSLIRVTLTVLDHAMFRKPGVSGAGEKLTSQPQDLGSQKS